MEPRNAIADYDRDRGRSTLYTATQGPHFVRDPLAEAVLKIPKDRLRVITPNVGGAFGMKAFVYPEHALVVWASRKLERPVKWQEDRSEEFVSDNQGRDHTTRAELALDDAGRFLGLRVSILANLGNPWQPASATAQTSPAKPAATTRHFRRARDPTIAPGSPPATLVAPLAIENI